MRWKFHAMRRPSAFPLILGTALLAVGAAPVRAQGQGFEWRAATPESQGFSRAKLEALGRRMEAKKTKAFLVIRNDRVVYEWYAPDHSAAKPHSTASLAKALVGGLALGVAITDGKVALDDPVSRFIPAWSADARKAKVTLRHLGSHTSGLADAESDGVPHEKLTGWKGDFWKRLSPPDDPFSIARDRAEMLFEPGERMQYSNPGIAVLTYCVTAAVRNGPQTDVRSLLRERLMRPMGVPDREWSIGYGQTFTVDGLPLVASWGGGAYTARAVARVGRLVLREGDWDGRRLLSAEAVRQVTRDAGLPGHCGMGWWTNHGGRYPRLPQDAVWGAGAGDQLLLVVPSLNLIMVRNGQTLEPGLDEPPIRQDDVFTRYHDYRAHVLFEALVDALDPAPPPSPVIQSLTWAPAETIRRAARGSDNWPLTWADDGHLYTAFGDGQGFEPFLPEKLSLGFARIEAGPREFHGINLRSPTGEQRGDGAHGRKASGLLMADGVLYLWARNAGNAQLAWSRDHGASWTWSDWKFTTSFGCPTFLNFGKNYAGARDDFVYIYSPDSASAYEPADRMVLARVPKDRVTNRAAYEFLAQLDSRSDPEWTGDIAHRGAVFSRPGRCYRSGITYDAPIGRYLWCQTFPAADARFHGGFAILDAPEPWGPWTTVFTTDDWDVGPGETSSFPTAWMSPDGKTLHLVFSGDDCFSVRAATLTLRQAAPRPRGQVP